MNLWKRQVLKEFARIILFDPQIRQVASLAHHAILRIIHQDNILILKD
jgi:hypothetical protein